MKRYPAKKIGVLCVFVLNLMLFSCSSNDNYPNGYAGFKEQTQVVAYGTDEAEMTVDIKIIAGNKEKTDRTVIISTPPVDFIKLVDKKVIIQAGKKSATAQVKVLPKKMLIPAQQVTITCSPQWKDSQASRMTLQIKKK